MEKQHLVPGDPTLIENIVSYLKAKGIFDEFRHECLADVDTKSSCQNLSQRVDGYTTKFLATETWNPDLNKNELRNKLRRHIDESGMLAVGADHVVEQVINPKIHQLFLPRIIEVVHQYLNQENEKLNKKQEAIDELAKSEKAASENSDTVPNKPKPVLDPIADILSFTYSKPKQTIQTPTPSTQNKSFELKIEKKKEEVVSQTKLTESVLKVEKKKDDPVIGKVQDITQKIKKEEISLPPKCQTSVVGVEIKEEETSDHSTKIQLSDSNDDSSQSATSQPKPVEVKTKKETKTEEIEVSHDSQKKLLKEEPKVEKKKIEESKLPKSEKTSQSEEASSHKTVEIPTKSSSGLSKNKVENEKKKIKSHSQHKTSNPNESHKVKVKESSSSVSSKSSSDKHSKSSSSSKHLKPSSSKDSSPMKVSASSKSVKAEKDESSNKSKTDIKSPDSSGKKSGPSKSSSTKKENLPLKVKHSSDKHEKHKSAKTLTHSQSDSFAEKGKKSSIQYSSSYDSSQGSDQDKSSTSSISSKEKQKHFSKHHKKESGEGSSDKNAKGNTEKKRPRTDSDSGTDKKHKNGKFPSKGQLEKHKKSTIAKESAKIDSRSNSLGSSSSTSDSQVSSSKDNVLSTSEDTSDNMLKELEKKKKQANKDSDRCREVKSLPPPPPPPPSSSMMVGTSSSAEVSSMDETQSSQESDSENESSDEDSSSESEVESDTLDVKRDLKTPEILNDVYDVFLYSSSSSEFEGYSSSPEKIPDPAACRTSDVSGSTIHTSDLSSFDDEISYTEESEAEDQRVKRKLTLKEAENLLRTKAEKRRSSLKISQPEVKSDERKQSNINLQSTTSTVSSEEEVSQRPEPKRESRRERKLNPKYASSEYTSIFNSKKTSFITKQANQGELPSPSVSPEIDSRKSNMDSKKLKDKQLSSQKNSFLVPDPNQCPKATSKLPCNEFYEPPSSPECSFILHDPSCEGSPSDKTNSSDRNQTGAENETHSRIALKIKMSAIKSDNQTNTDKNARSVKRKFDGETPSAKRALHFNSVTTESVANENEPFNNKTNSAPLVHSKEQEFFQLQKTSNNGDVLSRIEHGMKNSYSKPNHVAENNTSD